MFGPIKVIRERLLKRASFSTDHIPDGMDLDAVWSEVKQLQEWQGLRMPFAVGESMTLPSGAVVTCRKVLDFTQPAEVA